MIKKKTFFFTMEKLYIIILRIGKIKTYIFIKINEKTAAATPTQAILPRKPGHTRG